MISPRFASIVPVVFYPEELGMEILHRTARQYENIPLAFALNTYRLLKLLEDLQQTELTNGTQTDCVGKGEDTLKNPS